MMKFKLFIPTLILLLIFSGCQKEKSVELTAPAAGSLKSSITGDCNPITIKGVYKAGSALADTNYVDIEVNVSKAGSYTISTDTVNGYSFKGTGNFTSAGTNQVRLKASGKPLLDGDDIFEVQFDTTSCSFSVSVLPGNTPSGPAAFTLSGSGGNCMNAAVAGNYVKATAATTANTVSIEVNVTTPGTYTISTNSVNGIQFSGTGVFTAPGVQTAVLKASGTPTNSGNFNFSVTAGMASCAFSVTITDTAPPVTNTDHFPLSANSWWSYEDATAPRDSVKVENVLTGTIASATYNGFITSDDAGDADTSYYRKAGNDYFEYTFTDNYTVITFDAAQAAPILFLKEGLTSGATWNSAEYSGSASGQQIKLRYAFSCTDANATATINGVTYTNIYKVKMKPQVAVAIAPNSFSDTGEEIERWYAKGVGLIYLKVSASGTVFSEINIRNSKVL